LQPERQAWGLLDFLQTDQFSKSGGVHDGSNGAGRESRLGKRFSNATLAPPLAETRC
jgi:hypothetical protein